MNKIRVFEAFSGIGAQAMSLKRLQAEYPDMLDFEFVGTSEIEPSAIKAYTAVHGDVKCYGDITQIDWSQVPDFDLFTMSSPCQDFSVAGRQAGAEEGSGTRSSLLWECRKAILAKKPKYILFENVSAVVSKKFIRGFNKWQAELESYGYTNFAKVLNSKDYGIPQNRERLFMISILDCTKSYHFPEPFKLEKRIKDILEPYGTVDESFYFSPEQLLRIIANTDKTGSSDIQAFGKVNNSQDGIIVTDDSISPCHCAGHGNVPKVAEQIKESVLFNPMDDGTARTIKAQYARVGQANCIRQDDFGASVVIEPSLHQRLSLYADNAQAGRVYDVEGISPCLDTCSGGNRMPKILEPVAVAMRGRNPDNPSDRSKGCPTKQTLEFGDNVANCITTVQKDSMVAEPMVGNDPRRIFGQDDFKTDVCPALMAVDYKAPKLVKEPIELSLTNLPDKTVLKDEDGKGYLWQDGSLWRVRRLVPIETSRLMDVADEDFYKMQKAGISKTALYSLFGNSIVVAVLYHIFRKLWIDTECESAQKSLFDF